MPDQELVANERETADQVAAQLLQAGFTPDQAAQMVAIALHESGFDAGILNNTPATGDYSVGLWQINYYGDLAPTRTQEFGSPASLAGNPQAQANAAHTLFEQSGYSPWQPDFTDGAASANLPVGVQAVNDVSSGKVTVGTAQASSSSLGYGGGTTAGTGYSAASTSFGRVLQEIDGFYNPSVSAVPSWWAVFGGGAVNDVASIVATGIDRAIGVLFGAGMIILGIKLISDKQSGGQRGVLSTGLRVAGDLAVGREAHATKLAVEGARTERTVATLSQRQQSQQQRAQERAQRDEQARSERTASAAARKAADARRKAENDRRHKLSQERLKLARAAEARRSAEDRNAARRRATRPVEREGR